MPSGVYEHKPLTEEHRRKIGLNNLGKRLGKPSPMKGKHMSEEAKKKIGLANLGRHHTKETIEKMRIIHSKENLSDQTLRKMSIANSGRPSPMKDKHHTKESKEKMRVAHLGLPSWAKGKHFSKEYRKKLSEAQKGRRPTKETLRKILGKRSLTNLEVIFQSIVDKYNLPYKYVGDGSFIIDCYCPDFINTNSKKIAIEVYAKYFKKKSMSIEDWKIQRAEVFKQYGWKIIYFNENEVNEENVLNKINEVNK